MNSRFTVKKMIFDDSELNLNLKMNVILQYFILLFVFKDFE